LGDSNHGAAVSGIFLRRVDPTKESPKNVLAKPETNYKTSFF